MFFETYDQDGCVEWVHDCIGDCPGFYEVSDPHDDGEDFCEWFTNVDISPDFHSAKIYFSVYDAKKLRRETVSEMNRLTKAFKKYLSPQLHLRVTPDLRFIYDERYEYGEKIERLIKTIDDNDS